MKPRRTGRFPTPVFPEGACPLADAGRWSTGPAQGGRARNSTGPGLHWTGGRAGTETGRKAGETDDEPRHWDHLPRLLALDRGVYAGLGYNGRGVASATLMGQQLAGTILGDVEPLVEVRGPDRFAFHRLRQIGISYHMLAGRLLDRIDRRGMRATMTPGPVFHAEAQPEAGRARSSSRPRSSPRSSESSRERP